MHTKEKAATKHLGQHNSPELRKKKKSKNEFILKITKRKKTRIYIQTSSNKQKKCQQKIFVI